MKFSYFLLVIPLVLFLFCISSSIAIADPNLHTSPSVNATAHVMIDPNSGYIIAGHEVDKRIPPASLTKIMTAYVIASELKQGNIDLEDQVLVSEKAWRAKGSRMFIEVGKKVQVADLLKGIIIQSGNDASIAMAEFVAGSESGFVSIMNRHAEKLSLHNTHFVNSTGLPDPDHYTSVRDLATLSYRLIQDFPDVYAWHSVLDFTYNGIKQLNRNRLLLHDNTVDGVKTGHTEEAGYCLVAAAVKNGMRLISVVAGTKSSSARFNASQSLLHYGFRFYETHKLYSKGDQVDTVRVWKGVSKKLELGLAQDLYVTVARGEYDKLKAEIGIENKIVAPVNIGDQVATLYVKLKDEDIVSKPLFALHDIAQAGFFSRARDHIDLLFAE